MAQTNTTQYTELKKLSTANLKLSLFRNVAGCFTVVIGNQRANHN